MFLAPPIRAVNQLGGSLGGGGGLQVSRASSKIVPHLDIFLQNCDCYRYIGGKNNPFELAYAIWSNFQVELKIDIPCCSRKCQIFFFHFSSRKNACTFKLDTNGTSNLERLHSIVELKSNLEIQLVPSEHSKRMTSSGSKSFAINEVSKTSSSTKDIYNKKHKKPDSENVSGDFVAY